MLYEGERKRVTGVVEGGRGDQGCVAEGSEKRRVVSSRLINGRRLRANHMEIRQRRPSPVARPSPPLLLYSLFSPFRQRWKLVQGATTPSLLCTCPCGVNTLRGCTPSAGSSWVSQQMPRPAVFVMLGVGVAALAWARRSPSFVPWSPAGRPGLHQHHCLRRTTRPGNGTPEPQTFAAAPRRAGQRAPTTGRPGPVAALLPPAG